MKTSTQTNIIHLEKRKGAQLQNEIKKLDKKGHSSRIESRRKINKYPDEKAGKRSKEKQKYVHPDTQRSEKHEIKETHIP